MTHFWWGLPSAFGTAHLHILFSYFEETNTCESAKKSASWRVQVLTTAPFVNASRLPPFPPLCILAVYSIKRSQQQREHNTSRPEQAHHNSQSKDINYWRTGATTCWPYGACGSGEQGELVARATRIDDDGEAMIWAPRRAVAQVVLWPRRKRPRQSTNRQSIQFY